MAEKYRYSVVPILFNYSDYDEYGKHAPIDRRTMIDIKKTRATMVGLKKHPAVKGVLQIKNNDFGKVPVITCTKHELLRRCILPEGREILVVSDIHGCYDEFLTLLGENKIRVEEHRILENPAKKHLVLAGDYIDSGDKVEDMIDFCYENSDITVIIGNHENRLYRELTQGLEHLDEPWFDSFHRLDEPHKERFLRVFRRSVPFALSDFAIITHAPCPVSCLGKLDADSQVAQRYFPHGKDEKLSLYHELEQLQVFDGDMGSMLHIFGHIPTANPGKAIDGRMPIDGGCVLGGKLVGVSIAPDGKAYVKLVSSQRKEKTSGMPIRKYAKPEQQQDIDLNELSYGDRERIKELVLAKVNFFSGTMSPAAALGGQLESIEAGIKFFQDKGITDVVMQPKYMGSRCNLYLFATNEESYAISRNGHRIAIDLSAVFDAMRERLKDHFDWTKVRFLLIDGELMPWSALGEGLIQEFRRVSANVRQEIQFLKENDFAKAYLSLRESFAQSGFSSDKNHLPKGEMAKKYGNAAYETYKAVEAFQGYVPLEERERLNGIYMEQLHLYGEPGPLEYKPFAILKVVYLSGEETIYYREKETAMTNYTMFQLLNSDGCHRYDLGCQEDVEECVRQFHRYTTEEKHEGVVLKPNRLDARNVPPYLKVRNREYLTIIYGHDYLTEEKHKKLCARKSIKGKLQASLREWRKGLALLAVKYDDIRLDNENLKKLYASFLFEEAQEQVLDPRL